MSVFFYGCITLDGYLANKNHGLDWLHQTGNAGDTGYDAFYQKMDVTIMGKRTYDEIAAWKMRPASILPRRTMCSPILPACLRGDLSRWAGMW